jgi:methylated-DNA-[protein]-cysteine S-methyltransferase
MTELETTLLTTPGGLLAVVVDPTDGAVVVSGFSSLTDQQGRLAEPLQGRGFHPVSRSVAMSPVAAAVADYSDGDADALDRVAVRQAGGPFLQDAWVALRGVKAGRTASYSELAVLAGRPNAVRAAGSACARNMVAPFVPCHRILRSDGTLGGYAYGLPTKAALLRHEHALAEPAALFA